MSSAKKSRGHILLDSYEMDVALQLTVEDDFSYFCN